MTARMAISPSTRTAAQMITRGMSWIRISDRSRYVSAHDVQRDDRRHGASGVAPDLDRARADDDADARVPVVLDRRCEADGCAGSGMPSRAVADHARVAVPPVVRVERQ